MESTLHPAVVAILFAAPVSADDVVSQATA
jgi:hypothetical protein